ncbi:MAG: aminodeoxychorismate/anthranilate synthase component II [Eubacteriales bacterium]|nr:aminodeoxychorismate/anthranilate synthase component II [Eubacteriales bacterium]
MILLIDNYDSFSYNLYQLLGSVHPDIEVRRNDKITLEEIEEKNPELIVLSPGPGKPSEAGVCEEVVRYFAGKIPIFGVCLGHQVICEALGGEIIHAEQLMHGKQDKMFLNNLSHMFKGMPSQIMAARYHSLAAENDTLPACLKVTAKSKEGEIMAVEHTKYPIYGVQFHPESVMTPQGLYIIKNIWKDARVKRSGS